MAALMEEGSKLPDLAWDAAVADRFFGVFLD